MNSSCHCDQPSGGGCLLSTHLPLPGFPQEARLTTEQLRNRTTEQWRKRTTNGCGNGAPSPGLGGCESHRAEESSQQPALPRRTEGLRDGWRLREAEWEGLGGGVASPEFHSDWPRLG